MEIATIEALTGRLHMAKAKVIKKKASPKKPLPKKAVFAKKPAKLVAKKKKVVKKTIKAAKPAAKSIVRTPPKESVKTVEKKIQVRPKVQTAEGWKRGMLKLRSR